jgi:hypothetical protein
MDAHAELPGCFVKVFGGLAADFSRCMSYAADLALSLEVTPQKDEDQHGHCREW